jgi:hypothetical protein
MRRLRFPFIVVLTAIALAPTLTGCSRGHQSVVRGKVDYYGKPADGALVIFNPVDNKNPKAIRPQVTVGSDGSFEMGTTAGNDGVPPGEYDVTFVWLIEDPKTKREWSPLPTRYMAPEYSGVRVTVREGTNDLPPFQLTW